MEERNPGNWFLAIAKINLPLILWGVFLVAVIVTGLTFCFSPIYKATTILTLDSDAGKVLKGLTHTLPLPSSTSTDYIRYEYFAIHNVTLMRSPDLAREVVTTNGITDGSGTMILPENFVAPSLFTLLFKNNGQGINPGWVSDTQQFSITGYSKDPNKAVEFSKLYTEAFLKKNAEQFRNIINVIETRFMEQLKNSTAKIKELEHGIQKLTRKHNIFKPADESEELTSQIVEIGERLSSIRFSEKIYEEKIRHLSTEAKYYEKLLTYRRFIRTNPLINELKTKVVNLRGRLIAASVEYTPEHPEYLSIKKSLDDAKSILDSEAQKYFYQETQEASPVRDDISSTMFQMTLDHQVFKSEVNNLEALLRSYQGRLNELTEVQISLDSLTEELNLFNQLKSTAEKELITIRNIADYPLPFFRIVSSAWINLDNLKHYKFFPKRKTALLVSSLLAFIIFSFLVVAREMQLDLLYYSWQIPQANSDFRVAEIPTIHGLEQVGFEAEATICSHIRNILPRFVDTKTIRIVSDLKGEGKATVGRSLAWYFSKLGDTVLLVDGDSDYQSCTKALGMADRPGLADCILGGTDPMSVIIQYPGTNIRFIPGGSLSASDTDPNSRKSLSEVMGPLSAHYDKIIFIDTPLRNTLFPSFEGVDHETVIVLRSGKHSIPEFKNILNAGLFTRDNRVKISSVILNKLPFVADVLTLRGLRRLTLHLVKQPFRVFRSQQ